MNFKLSVGMRWLLASMLSLSSLCCGKPYDNSLPDSQNLGSPRGYRIARVITHSHTPYSYDACDKNGLPGGTLNMECLEHIRLALCRNRIDLALMSDHPDHMANYPISDLLLSQGQDRIEYRDGEAYANHLAGCENGFTPTMMTGIEGRLLALGLTHHLGTDVPARLDLYRKETLALRTQLAFDGGAVVAIPHTESRTVDDIMALAPDAIEIYNSHANLDPKIRQNDLGAPPFENLPSLLTYLVDPYHSLNPDFSFMGFVRVYPLYFHKWDDLISRGLKVTGLGGTDSHENVFKQKVSDGERLDAHRRMFRFMSNHLLVHSLDPEEIKTAIRTGKSYVVFEGLGSPSNMDFFATSGALTVGMGESMIMESGKAVLHVRAPHLFSGSPHGENAPEIRIELKKVGPGAQDVTIARSSGEDLDVEVSSAGSYRFETFIRPRHLKPWLGSFSDYAENEYTWVISNHLYLTP